MRTCIVVDNLDPNAGWGRLALKVADGITKKGHAVGFISEKKSEGIGNPNLVVPLKLSFNNILRLPSTLLAIRTFIANYDVVLCFDVNPNGIILNLANLGQKRKIIIHALATYSIFGHGTPIRNLFMRWAYHRSVKNLVVSEFTKKQIEQGGFKLSKCAIVPVGVDTHVFFPLSSQQSRLPYSYILSVGALKPRKGYHISILAFKLATKEFPEIKYVIVGDQSMASYFDSLKKFIHEHELNDRVIFLEKISDSELVNYYRSASLFVLTPLTTTDAFEGFGMVYLEASACETPVIGTYDSGAEAAIIDEYNGLLVKPEPEEVSSAMQKLLHNPDLAKTFSSNGLKRSAEFDWEKVVDLYITNFNDVLKKD